LTTFSIPFPFLKEEPYSNHSITLKVTKEELLASNAKYLKEVAPLVDHCRLEVEIRDISSFQTMICPSPNEEVVEDRVKKNSYGFGEMKNMLSRGHATVMPNVMGMHQLERVIFNFKYPNFSKFILVCSLIFTMNFDPAYILSY
jgi:hypothetical protein